MLREREREREQTKGESLQLQVASKTPSLNLSQRLPLPSPFNWYYLNLLFEAFPLYTRKHVHIHVYITPRGLYKGLFHRSNNSCARLLARAVARTTVGNWHGTLYRDLIRYPRRQLEFLKLDCTSRRRGGSKEKLGNIMPGGATTILASDDYYSEDE